MSRLYRPIDVDLSATPVLTWRSKVRVAAHIRVLAPGQAEVCGVAAGAVMKSTQWPALTTLPSNASGRAAT